MEKFYCKHCCQIFSEKTVCPQCQLHVDSKIHIHVQNQEDKKKTR